MMSNNKEKKLLIRINFPQPPAFLPILAILAHKAWMGKLRKLCYL